MPCKTATWSTSAFPHRGRDRSVKRQPLSIHCYGPAQSWFPIFWGLVAILMLLAPILPELENSICILMWPLAVVGPVVVIVLFLANLHPNIRILETGLEVQVFLFWWDFVPWDDIHEVRDQSVGKWQINLVIVRKLTPAHRLIGLMYAGWSKHAFLINYRISGYYKLMDTIMTRTGLSDR